MLTLRMRGVATSLVLAAAGAAVLSSPIGVRAAAVDRTGGAVGGPAVAPAPSGASTASPRILFGAAPLPVSSPDLAPFRDPDDGLVYVAPATLAPLGITYIVDASAGVVALAGPDGGRVTTTVPVHYRPGSESDPDRRAFVPAKTVVEALGGKWEENASTGDCVAFAVLTDVQMLGGQLRIKTTLPVLPRVRVDHIRPDLVILDLPGTDVGAVPHALTLDSPNVAQARCGQFSDDTARIVLEMKASTSGPAPGSFVVLGGRAATEVALNPVAARTSVAAAAPAIVISNNNPGHVVVARVSDGGRVPPGRWSASVPAPTLIRSVAFRNVSDTEAQIVVAAGRAPNVHADFARGRLTVDMENAALASADVPGPLAQAKHPFLRAAQLVSVGPSAAQLLLDLTRTVTYTIRMIPGGGFVLDLLMPKSAGGRLAGKLVVIDPGHGDHDSGARGAGGACEKNVNLAIALKLAEDLRQQGANVILTRSNDEFVPVDDRPVIANRAGADFFISVHADSGDYNHSANGSTVYYHMQMPSCRALAQSIADRLADIGGIRSKGVRSDSVRFPTLGFGVLRGSQMVAVLCECGYMTNGADLSRLIDPVVQQRLADAIAHGLKDYIEGNPDFDSRDVNPQPEGVMAPLHAPAVAAPPATMAPPDPDDPEDAAPSASSGDDATNVAPAANGNAVAPDDGAPAPAGGTPATPAPGGDDGDTGSAAN